MIEELKKLIIKNANRDFIKDISFTQTSFNDLTNNLGYDSISIISLVIDIEDNFNIEIDDDYLLIEILNDIDRLAEIVANEGKSKK